MSRLQTGVLVLLAFAVVFATGYAVGAHYAPAPATAAARDSTRADVVTFDSSETTRHVSDSLARAQLAASEFRARTARHQAVAAGQAADSLSQLLDTVQVTADSLRRLAQATDSARQVQVAGLQRVIRIQDSTILAVNARWQDADSAAATAQRFLHQAAERLDRVTAMTRPPRCALGIAAGYGLRGPDAVAGFTCRL